MIDEQKAHRQTAGVPPPHAETVRRLSDALVALQQPIRILDAIAWDESVRADFFAHDCRRQPCVDVDYYARRPLEFDADALRSGFRDLEREIARRLGDASPAGRIMDRMCREYRLVVDMLEARGTPAFAEHAASLYGRASEPLHVGQASLVDLATQLEESLALLDRSAFVEPAKRDIPVEQAVAILQARLDASMGAIGGGVRVSVDDGIVADAAAGSDYIKLRAGALFSQQELALLEAHEGWVHVGTTLNGRAQRVCSFLGKGTPATAVTQEGLAVLVEVTSLRSHPARLRRITDRIRAIHRAESGASFLEVFDGFREAGRSREEAWTVTMRVFRGSRPEGGPFTKDLAYSKGFVELYNFLRLAVRRGSTDRIPLLFVGKVLLDEVGLLADLRDEGLLDPPRFLPPTFADPSGLMSWLAFSSFLNRLDLSRIEGEYAELLD